MSKSKLFSGAAGVALSLVFAQTAYAQGTTDCPKRDANGNCVTATEASSESDIVVVGSRIRRDTFNTAAPVTLITRDEAIQAGFNSTTAVLQSTAVTGGSSQINNAFGGYVTNGGPGANTLSLRGLGATRTLILLNGRRIAPAGSRGSVGSADLNVLPSAMVDHVEVLKDGASSIYGSDAVAGVVNVVTRKNLNGWAFEGQVNAPEAGAGTSMRTSLVYGHTADRFHFAISGEYYRRDNLTLGDRSFTACQTEFLKTPGSNSPGASGDWIDPRTGAPKCYPTGATGESGVTVNAIATSTTAAIGAPGSTAPGVLGLFNRLRPNSSITTGVAGWEGVNGGATIAGLGARDTYNQRLLSQSLISPATVYTGFGQIGYDLHALGGAEVYAEVLFNRRDSKQIGFRQLSLDYAKGSPLIPANLAFSQVQTAPTPTTNGKPLGVRVFTSNMYDSNQRVDFLKASAGIRGDLFAGWRYDLYGSHTVSNATYTFQLFLTDRLAQSMNVVSNGAGGFNCVDPSNGCVAAPAITPAFVGGDYPQAWFDFVQRPVTGRTKYFEDVVNLALDGKLFSLPYGDVKAAIGAEYRHQRIDDTPDANMIAGNVYNFSSAGITRGTDSVKEVYGEIEVPLLRNLPMAQELTFNGSARYTDYRSYGANWTYKLSGMYTPFDFIKFRGTYGTSYRAPALFEQYLSPTSGFISSLNDPCNQYGSGDPSTALYKNCAAAGLPGTFTQTSSVAVLSAGGALTGLKAETSKNWTLGLILQPKFSSSFGNLSFAVDYYSITVSNGVSRIGGGNLASLCYNDPRGLTGSPYCTFVSRNATTAALTVQDNYINISTDRVKGLDYSLRYTHPLAGGQLRLSAEVSQYLDQSSRVLPTDPLIDANRTIGAPEFTGTFEAQYKIKQWRFYWGMEWINSMDSYGYLTTLGATGYADYVSSKYVMRTAPYFLHNASIAWQGDRFGITAGVRNIFNTDPPMISASQYNRVGNAPLYSGYDYVGRTYFVNFQAKF